ncbi:CHASE2 domain-containing protein [Lusitaniella coriacea]|uniref:CHASE2 domain-containing protein n=1 Tax=Lusitaniella coriacea TaxID=1983105 RepID=UPI003CFB8F4A
MKKGKRFRLKQLRRSLSNLSGLPLVAIAVFGIASSLIAIRHFGKLEAWELYAYDRFVRLRPESPPDPRLLLIGITEEDLRQQKQWPLSDRAIAQLLQKLQALEPQVIGLDLFRDFPIGSGRAQLVEQLQQPNVISIRSIDTFAGTAPPPEVSPEQVGFNDLLIDPDGVVRRNLLFAEGEEGGLFSFSLRVAIEYLDSLGITPQSSAKNPNNLQLGQGVFVPLRAHSGGYQNADIGGYQILLNYRSGTPVAREISLTQALSGAIDPAWVKGKIVLIGSTAPNLRDIFFTPYSPSASLGERYKMSGVAVHAQMVSQILDAATGARALFWYWSERQELLWIAIWTLLGGGVGWVFRHPLTVFCSGAVGLGLLWSSCFYLFLRGGWVPLVAPGLGFSLTLGAVAIARSYDSYRQRQIVMELLGQNTAPEIARTLWQARDTLLQSGKLPGVELTATIFFLDVRGFSSIAERMEPRDLLNWLNELLDAIAREVLTRQGIINKFTGDGLMAVFGIPLPRDRAEDIALDAQHAVECALAARDRLSELNQNWQPRGLPVIQIRIGIFTGAVVAGSLGGKDRWEYGILGDSVNIAARLESYEKQRQPDSCRILITQETLNHLRDRFEVESWGSLALKGKQRQVKVYRVLHRKNED